MSSHLSYLLSLPPITHSLTHSGDIRTSLFVLWLFRIEYVRRRFPRSSQRGGWLSRVRCHDSAHVQLLYMRKCVMSFPFGVLLNIPCCIRTYVRMYPFATYLHAHTLKSRLLWRVVLLRSNQVSACWWLQQPADASASCQYHASVNQEGGVTFSKIKGLMTCLRAQA